MPSLSEQLQASAALHGGHLCPRQVLGVRIGRLAGEWLHLELPQPPQCKRLLAIVETDGCAADGVAVATNCWVGHRTLRVEDYGKIAATFIDVEAGQAVRIAPRGEARPRARSFAPEARDQWEAYLLGYQRMPTTDLLCAQAVRLAVPLEKIVSHWGKRAVCQRCGEEIMNEREVVREGATLCRACAGEAYYSTLT